MTAHGGLEGVEAAEGGRIPQGAANVAANTQDGATATNKRALTYNIQTVLFRMQLLKGQSNEFELGS